jgi:hypothetical protein
MADGVDETIAVLWVQKVGAGGIAQPGIIIEGTACSFSFPNPSTASEPSEIQ